MRYILILFLIASSSLILAQSLKEGSEAYKNRDFDKAVGIFTSLCEKGNGEACYKLADMYDIGLGVQLSEGKALSFFEKACNFKYDRGCIAVKDRDESLHVG